MTRRIVDLSMPVHPDMLTFPRVPPPALCVYESAREFAERIGAAAHGVDFADGELPRGAERPRRHALDAASTSSRPPAVREIPLESATPTASCSTSATARGATASPRTSQAELDRIEYKLKENDIVLIHTGAGAYNTEERYQTDHPGHDRRGRARPDLAGGPDDGCDAITFDPPVWAMFERSSSGRRTG